LGGVPQTLGTLILNFDVGHAPTAAEPHALTQDRIRAALGDMTIGHEQSATGSHGDDGQQVVMVAQRT
jgi:hypothetical protein